jgi:NAD-dependent dihydropyrimidine dehydrogenase PreA subunit
LSRPTWFIDLIKKIFPGRFRAAELTRVPGIGRAVDRALFAGDDIIYLPKDNVIPIGRSIPGQESLVLPSHIVEHFIEQAVYHWIMNFCICRDASACRDYPITLGCLFLGEAVLEINPQHGRLVSKKEALAHARRCREAGLVHLIGRNKLDTVWLGAGPGHKLMTICNCCPCCCLWRMLPQIDPAIGHRVSRLPGISVIVTDRCAGCGTCAEGICFVDAIRLQDGRATISDACRGCGRCVEICPTGAIELTVGNTGFVDSTIARLTPLVDVT